MANTRFQLKRSIVSGVVPTTSDIAAGELAINLADKKLFSSNGSAVFEVSSSLSSNLTNLTVSANVTVGNGSTGALIFESNTGLVANGSYGYAGQVLTSNGSSVYWANASGGGTGISTIVSEQFTANGTSNTFLITGGYIPGAVEVYLNGIKQIPGVDVDVTSGANVAFLYTPANGQLVDVFGYQTSGVTSNTLTVNNFVITGSLTANSSTGTAGQVLHSNGTSVYWDTDDQGVTSVSSGSGLTGGPITTTGTLSVQANDGISANGSGVFVVQGTGTVVNASGVHVNSSYIATLAANSATYLGNSSGTIANISSWVTGNAATAYSNATSYADTAASTAAGTAYANAVANAAALYQTTAGLSANVATLAANSATYLGNSSGTIANISSWVTGNSATAYSNATSYADTAAGTAYANAVANAAALYQTTAGLAANVATLAANSATYLGNSSATVANVASWITGNADTAYTNATTYASNASNLSTGTVAEARLPYRMDQNVRTTDTVSFGGLTITGNLTVGGNVTVIGANNLSVVDNMIYLNSNSTVTNPDLGFAGNYNDGTYKHTGFFRDASDGVWKVFDGYTPEPDASPYIDTSNNSFNIAAFQANNIFVGNTSVYGTINATSFTGTANSATYLGNSSGTVANIASWVTGNSDTAYTNATVFASNASNINTGTLSNARLDANVVNTSAAFTITGVQTYNANLIVGATGALIISNGAGVYANGSLGSANQVLTSNGTGVFWANASGGFTNGQSISVNNFVISGTFTANSATGTNGQFLTSNSSGGVYWSNGNFASSVRQSFTANATVNTTFTVTGGYAVGYLDVYKNGIKLQNGSDVTVTDGSTIVLSVAADLDDIIDAVGFIVGSTSTTVVSQQFTANGTANSFTIAGGYIPSAIEVFVSGVKRIPGVDVTVTSGSTVDFVTPPLNGQTVDVFGYKAGAGVTTGGTVFSVTAGNGLTGNITSTGTISVLANTGLIANATGLHVNSSAVVVANSGIISNATGVYVNANNGLVVNSSGVFINSNNGITANSSGVFVTQGTGTVVNATGVHVNSSYIATLAANSATYLGSSSNFGNSTGIYDAGGNLRDIPVNSQTTTYTIANTDAGKIVSSNANITVNGAILYANFATSVYNNSSANITISSGTGVTMYLAGQANTSTRTLAQRGVATILCVAANTFVISGSGLT